MVTELHAKEVSRLRGELRAAKAEAAAALAAAAAPGAPPSPLGVSYGTSAAWAAGLLGLFATAPSPRSSTSSVCRTPSPARIAAELATQEEVRELDLLLRRMCAKDGAWEHADPVSVAAKRDRLLVA